MKTTKIILGLALVFSIYSCNKDDNNSLDYKLKMEIIKILKKQSSSIFSNKKHHIKNSLNYQSNVHFRW